jgi:hypothetical protein
VILLKLKQEKKKCHRIYNFWVRCVLYYSSKKCQPIHWQNTQNVPNNHLNIVIQNLSSWTPVAHSCNPSYLGGWDPEDCGSRPVWTNSVWDPISKITRAKWTRSVAQAVESLLCESEALSSNPSPTKINR